MTTVTIELPDDQAAALSAMAAKNGLTLQDWLRRLVGGQVERVPGPLQSAADIVLESMRQVPREDFANRPKDGASEHDHYLYGHQKRHQ